MHAPAFLTIASLPAGWAHNQRRRAAMSKPKAVSQVIKLLIKAGQAKPGPPVGAALGQAGLKIIDFTKDFNAKTSEIAVSLLCLTISR